MNPLVSNLSENSGRLMFTLSGVNVSIANALRRIIISEIPCVVFRTTPHEENRLNIQINTSRMNNELIKQRMSCVPIHVTDVSTPIENYEIIVDMKNDGDIIEYVTTKEITIKDTQTGKMLSETAVRKIFPPDPITGDYIDIVRLRPRLSEDIHGEHLKFVARLDIGTAKENGSFNIVSTCSYGNTEDPISIKKKLEELLIEMKSDGMDADTIEFKKKDWLLLNAQMYSIPDSFDFIIETIGQFANMDIVLKGAFVMLDKIKTFKSIIQTDEELISQSETTLENGFDIKLISEDYTLGKAIEFVLYSSHYDRFSTKSDKSLTFCGFRKPHPHIDESVIRIGFVNSVDKQTVVQIIVEACKVLEATFTTIADFFRKVD
jgi:DNA-directed RNA polymerase subunit L